MSGKLLMKMARTPLMGKLMGSVFRWAGWLLPVKKIISDKYFIAFRHPRPAYENHLILSPKKSVPDLPGLMGEETCFLRLWQGAQDICKALAKQGKSWVLVANGGKRQEVQQVHFHLFTGHEMVREYTAAQTPGNILYRDETLCLLAHPSPEWELHAVIVPAATSPAATDEMMIRYLQGVLHCIWLLNGQHPLLSMGYSLVQRIDSADAGAEMPVFHIVAGGKLR